MTHFSGREKASWALAYVLVDWKRRGRKALVDAQRIAQDPDGADPLPAIREAQRRIRAYNRALLEAAKLIRAERGA